MRSPPFSKQPAELSARAEDHGVLIVRGGGFVTRELITDALRQAAQDRPGRVLVDVREIAGYERDCGPVARDLVERAHTLGVDRIALVASSAVLRTAARMLASRAPVPLRAFEHPAQARRWLDREHERPPPCSAQPIA